MISTIVVFSRCSVILPFSFVAAACLAISPEVIHAGVSPASAPTVTFTRDVAPIVYDKCSTCHHPGEAAPFSLLTYDDVRRHGQQIVEVTQRRFMPPWLPSEG